MIGERLKAMHYRANLLTGYQKREKQKRREKALDHYNDIIGAKHGEKSKVFKLEQSEEGDTRIRKVRL